MKMFFFIVLSMVFISSSANAGWVDVELIDIRAAKSPQNEYWMQVRDFSNPENCANSDFIVLIAGGGPDSGSNWWAVHNLLVKGFFENKPMEVRVTGCTNLGYSEIDSVLIKNR